MIAIKRKRDLETLLLIMFTGEIVIIKPNIKIWKIGDNYRINNGEPVDYNTAVKIVWQLIKTKSPQTHRHKPVGWFK